MSTSCCWQPAGLSASAGREVASTLVSFVGELERSTGDMDRAWQEYQHRYRWMLVVADRLRLMGRER